MWSIGLERWAHEGHGQPALRGHRRAIEAIEQRRQGFQVAVDATEQPVEHGVVELEATARGAATQRLAAPVVIEDVERDAQTLPEARAQVGQRPSHVPGRKARGIEQRAPGIAQAVVQVEQGFTVLA